MPETPTIEARLAALTAMPLADLRQAWQRQFGHEPTARLSRDLMIRALAYAIQERAQGGLASPARRRLQALTREIERKGAAGFDGDPMPKPGSRLVREWEGRVHTVFVLEDGFEYDGERYRSLTQIAGQITGAHWSGPRFFGLGRPARLKKARAGHG